MCLVYDRECAEMWSDLRFSEHERIMLIEENSVLLDSSADLYATLAGKQGT